MYTEGCRICGALELPHKEGCMYRSCNFGPHGEPLKDPLVHTGRTITDLAEMVEKCMGMEI